MKPPDAMMQGVAILEPILNTNGFVFRMKGTGTGSGGDFAVGEFVKENRRIEFHFRKSLGVVVFADGDAVLGHSEYMKALGVAERSEFSTCDSSGLGGFCALARDLANFCGEFTSGNADVLKRAAPVDAAIRQARSRESMASYVGDERRREAARVAFQAGDYSTTRKLLEKLEFPDLLTDSERRMLELSRGRART